MKNLLYAILFGVVYLFSLLPFKVLYLISDCLYYPLYYCIRYRRKIVRKNLCNSFPEKTLKEIQTIEKKFYSFFCDYIVETLKLISIKEKTIRKRMTFSGMEEIEKAIIEYKSCCLYAGHYCNWEWISSFPLHISRDIRCGQIYLPLQNKLFDRLMLYLRSRFRAECIAKKSTLRWIADSRSKGKPFIAGFISDQRPQWHSIHHYAEFFHQKTSAFTGTERIARQLGSCVFYTDVKRVKRGYYHCRLRPLTFSPNDLQEYELTDLYFKLLEETVRREPSLWLWSHNRWKK